MINGIIRDLRHTGRMLFKNPGFTFAAIFCLALGIGASTAIFGVVNAVLLRPLPYSQPERLARIYTEFPTFPNGGLRRFAVSAPEYFDLKRDAKQWDSLETWRSSGVNVAGGGEPTRVTASFVSGGLLQTLGIEPIRGRLISAADDSFGAPGVANISYRLWWGAFGGDDRIVGKEILLNGTKSTVIGVMPKDFRFPPGEIDAPDLWVPLRLNPANLGERGAHSYQMIGRLKHGVNLAQAQAELDAMVIRSKESGSADHHFDPGNHTLVTYGLGDEVVRTVRPALRMLLGAVCFVLLIACVNVANLLLARAEARQRETAIRSAIGASLRRLTAQFITEGLVLSGAGALLGLFLAHSGLQLVKASSEASIPRASEIGIDAFV